MPRRKKLFLSANLIGIVFIISVILAIPYYVLFTRPQLIAQSDLVSFITGAQMLKEGTENIYDLQVQHSFQQKVLFPYERDGVLPFKYLPVFSLPFFPLTFLPLRLSYIIFACFNLIVLGAFIYISSNIFTKINKIRYWFLIPFIFLPNILTTLLGQISFILVFIYLYIYKSIRNKNALLGGVITGLLLIKPQYIIAAPFFLILTPDRKRFLYGLAASSLFVIIASIYLSDVKTILNYPDFLLATENASFLERSQRMFTISSSLFYNLPLEIGYNSALYLNAALYLLGYYLFLKRYKLVTVDLAFVSATLFSLLFAVHVLEHDLSILLVPIFILMNLAFQHSGLDRKLKLTYAALLFCLPFIVLIISPWVGTLVALVIAMIMLYEEKGLDWIWKTKK